jgi:two-component system sensor histidine kinase/response regulator
MTSNSAMSDCAAPVPPKPRAGDAGPPDHRAEALFGDYQRDIYRRTDRLFAWLMGFQWIAGIVFALWVSPVAWEGTVSRIHLHVWAAVVLGGLVSLFPALLAVARPGQPSTRYTIAVAQMLMSALLIHLTGGRIETHFHVFGSLAFLAFYRDWRVLVPATVVVALDHMLRGLFWPQSVYGVLLPSEWRWVEHAAWVIFEDVFLIVSCRRSVVEMRERAARTAALEQEVRTRQHAESVLAALVAELRVAQRNAEAATRAKSEFLASMSHELRSPLNAIILYSELLQEVAEDQGQQSSITDLQRIQSSGKHLLELINGILDLSKIEAGKMSLSLEVFSVRSMVDELRDTVEPLVQKNGNTLTVNYAPGIGTMTADAMKTRQILLNLLSNAAKFTRAGTIVLDVAPSVVSGRASIEFSVTDSGVGMTAEQTSKIFDPFTQADVSTTRKYGGTGLGLALVSRFCRLMGGEVMVDSLPNEGSRFTVRLPVEVAETPDAVLSEESAA